MFLIVLYQSETWSCILREEHRLKVFENKMLTRMFELIKEQKQQETGEKCVMSIIIYTACQIVLGL
jgi:hypothetical protein